MFVRVTLCCTLALALSASACDGCLDVYVGEAEPDGTVFEPEPAPDAGAADVWSGDFELGPATTGELALYRRVTGDLRIVGLDLATLGLAANALTVDGDLLVDENTNLTSLITGGLSHVGGDVRVSNNPLLTSFSTTNLTSVDGDIRIVQNAALSFIGMSNVTAVGGSVTLYAGRNVRFDRLSTLEGSLVVGGPALEARPPVVTLSFPELTAVGADLLITGLAQLVTASFPLLTVVDGVLVISENPQLDTLEMGALSSVGVSLCVCQNPRLSTCVAQNIAAQVEGEAITKDTSGNDDTVVCE